jgi:hypothetical protein
MLTVVQVPDLSQKYKTQLTPQCNHYTADKSLAKIAVFL